MSFDELPSINGDCVDDSDNDEIMNEGIRWTRLTEEEINQFEKEHGFATPTFSLASRINPEEINAFQEMMSSRKKRKPEKFLFDTEGMFINNF